MSNLSEIQRFTDLFFRLFWSEIILVNQEGPAVEITNCLHESQEQYIYSNYPHANCLIFGYDIKPFKDCIDDLTFYFNILSFFDKYGKLILQQTYVDKLLTVRILVSVYNYHTKENVVIVVEQEKVELMGDYFHLNLVIILRKLLLEIFEKLENFALNSSTIKLFSSEFNKIKEDDDTQITRGD